MKTLIFTYGRFNPPTLGHELLFNLMRQTRIKYKHAETMVVLSHSNDKNKNPLDIDFKFNILSKAYTTMNFVKASSQYPSFIQHLTLASPNYDKLIFVCGEDRVEEYKRLLNNYNHFDFNFKEIEVMSVGKRDESDDVSGISGSKMRQFVKDSDKESFKLNCPLAFSEGFKNVTYNYLRVKEKDDE